MNAKKATLGRPARNGPHDIISAWVPADLKADVLAEKARLGTTISAVVVRRLRDGA